MPSSDAAVPTLPGLPVVGNYLPFGAGPRVCIGSHFAMMEAHLALATMAQQVEFDATTAGEVVPEPMITLRPRGGMPMRIRRRKGSSQKTRGLA
jgi:cytochrome P450